MWKKEQQKIIIGFIKLFFILSSLEHEQMVNVFGHGQGTGRWIFIFIMSFWIWMNVMACDKLMTAIQWIK